MKKAYSKPTLADKGRLGAVTAGMPPVNVSGPIAP